MATLIADNLTYSYSKKSKPALNKVSVAIKPGTLTALVGPNGAGKSTLLRLLQGQNSPDKGHITIDGKKLLSVRSQVALIR
jgi:zinc/manganese transport system ATP-binding protein